MNSASAKNVKKKRGKKKRANLSLAERRLVKLEAAISKIQGNKVNFEHFLTRLDTWLIENGAKIFTLFSEFDTQSDGCLSYDDFKAGMFDMNVPCDGVELHLLTKLLDAHDNGSIEYSELNKGLRWYLMTTELEKANQVQQGRVARLIRGQSAREIDHCYCCKVGLWTPSTSEPRYIVANLKLVTFTDTFKNHPLHLKKIIHSHITVYALIQMIKAETSIQSTTITIFKDKSRTPESALPDHMILDFDLGYEGGSRYSPVEHTFYYDYTAEFDDCPILLCDHYFTESLKI